MLLKPANPPAHYSTLQFDFLSLANNHILDYYRQGLLDTVKVYLPYHNHSHGVCACVHVCMCAYALACGHVCVLPCMVYVRVLCVSMKSVTEHSSYTTTRYVQLAWNMAHSIAANRSRSIQLGTGSFVPPALTLFLLSLRRRLMTWAWLMRGQGCCRMQEGQLWSAKQ